MKSEEEKIGENLAVWLFRRYRVVRKGPKLSGAFAALLWRPFMQLVLRSFPLTRWSNIRTISLGRDWNRNVFVCRLRLSWKIEWFPWSLEISFWNVGNIQDMEVIQFCFVFWNNLYTEACMKRKVPIVLFFYIMWRSIKFSF